MATHLARLQGCRHFTLNNQSPAGVIEHPGIRNSALLRLLLGQLRLSRQLLFEDLNPPDRRRSRPKDMVEKLAQQLPVLMQGADQRVRKTVLVLVVLVEDAPQIVTPGLPTLRRDTTNEPHVIGAMRRSQAPGAGLTVRSPGRP